MIHRRFYLGFLMGVAALLGTGAALAFLYFTAVEAQDRPEQPDSSPIETQSSSADIDPSKLPEACFNPTDQVLSANGMPENAAPMATYNAYLRITGSVLRPRTSNVEWTAGGQGGCIYATSGDQYTWFNTPVYLPNGVTVKYFRMYYNDLDSTHSGFGYFTVYDMYGNIVNEWGVSSSGSLGEGYVTTAEFTHTVDYATYSYVVNWSPGMLGSNMQLCGFRIFYNDSTSLVYMPLIENDEP